MVDALVNDGTFRVIERKKLDTVLADLAEVLDRHQHVEQEHAHHLAVGEARRSPTISLKPMNP